MLRLALVQMEICDADVSANLLTVERMVHQTDADLFLLPELFTTGYVHASWPAAADALGATLRQLHLWASSRKAWIGGSLLSRNASNRLCNRFWLVGPHGEEHSYDKIHLFPPMDEEKHLEAGSKPESVRINEFIVSLSICFDLRFPQMYLAQAAAGTSLFLVPAEWPHPRTQIMRTLAAARAIENQAFVAVCNRVGNSSDGSRFCGGSGVFAPDGSIIADATDQVGISIANIEMHTVDKFRSFLPIRESCVKGIDFA